MQSIKGLCIPCLILLCFLNSGAVTAEAPVPGLRILSPAPKAVFKSGETIEVVVEGVGDFVPEKVMVVTEGSVAESDVEPFRVPLPIPNYAVGTIEVMATGMDASGTFANSMALPLVIETGSKLTGISIVNSRMVFIDLSVNQQIRVMGEFDDGVKRELDGAEWPIEYESVNPDIAVVNEKGVVTAQKVGNTKIIVSLEDLTVEMPVNAMD